MSNLLKRFFGRRWLITIPKKQFYTKPSLINNLLGSHHHDDIGLKTYLPFTTPPTFFTIPTNSTHHIQPTNINPGPPLLDQILHHLVATRFTFPVPSVDRENLI